ncbi:hypothetical protein AAG570_008976 [Ranatra chinensis]|uniref:BHLH domain-containing protein n=1 Tax=Ranatra chinensis TaxID=642074 RepID=A0ABD0ZFS5_9HEMI
MLFICGVFPGVVQSPGLLSNPPTAGRRPLRFLQCESAQCGSGGQAPLSPAQCPPHRYSVRIALCESFPMHNHKYMAVPSVELNHLTPPLPSPPGGGGGRQLSLDETSTWTPSTMTEVSSRQGSSGSLNTCLISDKRRHDRRRERLNTELLTAALNGDKDEVRRSVTKILQLCNF